MMANNRVTPEKFGVTLSGIGVFSNFDAARKMAAERPRGAGRQRSGARVLGCG
jgi:hypothetical protein